MNSTIIKLISKYKMLLIWAGWSLLYIFLGMCLVYCNSGEINNHSLFFEADNGRVFQDLTIITGYDHYRIKVHPIMLSLLVPITSFIKAFVGDWAMSIIIFQSLIGASVNILLYKILLKLNIKEHLATILMLILGFSFSMIIFSTIPETFIFSTFFLVLFLYYIVHLQTEKITKLSMGNIIILCFLGMTIVGMSLGNYIPYLMGIIYILFNVYGKKPLKIFAGLITIIIGSLGLLYVILILQHLAYNNAPLFYTSLHDAIYNKANFEEYNYVDFSFSLQKLAFCIKQLLLLPILASSVHLDGGKFSVVSPAIPPLTPPTYPPPIIHFGSYLLITKIVFSVIFLSIIAPFVNFIRKKSHNLNIFIMGLSILSFYLISLFFYSQKEGFIFSSNFLYLIILIIAIVINELNIRWEKIVFTCLYTFLILEIINNTYYFINTAQIVASYFKYHSYNLGILLLDSLLIILSILLGLFGINKIFSFKKTINTDNKFLIGISVYLYMIILFCVGISMNAWKNI